LGDAQAFRCRLFPREVGAQVTEEQLARLERELARAADARNQTVEQWCKDSKKSDMRAYRIAAHVPELIEEIREYQRTTDQ
jgi:hypothetical protein